MVCRKVAIAGQYATLSGGRTRRRVSAVRAAPVADDVRGDAEEPGELLTRWE